MSNKIKKANIILEYQDYIAKPPIDPNSMYSTAASGDGRTIERWQNIWIDQYIANKQRFGSFSSMHIGSLYGMWSGRPAIVAGSGPSLAKNAHLLKDKPDSVGLISALHNFHYFEDLGVKPDFYVSLDAGEVTIEEVTEGCKGDTSEYWDKTKDHTLLAFVGSHPELLEKWQGKIYFFNAIIPDLNLRQKFDEVEIFHQWVATGGTVLGASMYIAKVFFGAPTICYVGSDFSFSNEHEIKFHPWNSKYDKEAGQIIKSIDVYGNKVKTWPSYYHFKLWFDYVAIVLPGFYINCTEGGILGSYYEGNLIHIKQMDLDRFFEIINMHKSVRHQALNPGVHKPDESNRILV